MVAQGGKDANAFKAVAFKNGIAISPEPFSERAFVYADGVFETMLVKKATIPLWDLHKARLARAGSILKLNIEFSRLENQIDSILADLNCKDGEYYVLKLIVGRAGLSRGSYAVLNSSSDYFALLKPFTPKYKELKARLKIVPEPLVVSVAYAGLKLINRMEYIVPTINESYASEEEALFLNASGDVIETMHHNIFVSKGDAIITPNLTNEGVHGVMRQCLIEKTLPSLGYTVKAQSLSLDMLKNADSVFITNALDGVVECAYLGTEKLNESALVNQIQLKLGLHE